MPPVPPSLGDGFENLGLLGTGGMGTVWKIRDSVIQKEFAVKVLREEFSGDSRLVERFKREASMAIELTHPNIAAVYKNGKDELNRPFIMMDYISGISLAEILAMHGALSVPRALNIFHQLQQALAHAHMKGIVHRDIKPSNIIVSKTNDGGELVSLIDFGIGKSLLESSEGNQLVTLTEDAIGSPLYISPEQCLGLDSDERSDIYSIGCVLYEMLSGAPPFKSGNTLRIISAHLSEAPDLSPIPEAQRFLVSKCLEKEPNLRPPSIDFLALLENNTAANIRFNFEHSKPVTFALLVLPLSFLIGTITVGSYHVVAALLGLLNLMLFLIASYLFLDWKLPNHVVNVSHINTLKTVLLAALIAIPITATCHFIGHIEGLFTICLSAALITLAATWMIERCRSIQKRKPAIERWKWSLRQELVGTKIIFWSMQVAFYVAVIGIGSFAKPPWQSGDFIIITEFITFSVLALIIIVGLLSLASTRAQLKRIIIIGGLLLLLSLLLQAVIR
jgi:serine/threonine protein kinase